MENFLLLFYHYFREKLKVKLFVCLFIPLFVHVKKELTCFNFTKLTFLLHRKDKSVEKRMFYNF